MYHIICPGMTQAFANDLIDYDRVVMETMTSFKRAGADIIISYHAKEVAIMLQGKNKV